MVRQNMNAINAQRGIKMKTTRFYCDQCHRDITYSENIRQSHALQLNNRVCNPQSSAIIFNESTLLDSDMDFCDFTCLKNWLNERA
jgi:hypothetical protein